MYAIRKALPEINGILQLLRRQRIYMEMYRFWGHGGFTNEVLILEEKAREGRAERSGSEPSRSPFQKGFLLPAVGLSLWGHWMESSGCGGQWAS